jgi:hypothetical protein
LGQSGEAGSDERNGNDFSTQHTTLSLAKAVGYFALVASVAFSPAIVFGASDSSESERVIQAYLAARQAHGEQLRGATMEVSIDASIPSLKKEGRLQALRKISELGKITYKVVGFQGDDAIKNEVIARYLEAEQKSQGSDHLALTPENYKFKYKGLHKLQNGKNIYVVFLTPRKKQVGLFKGEMWLDATTYLPIMESGKFVKNPSVFFKKVEFVRDYSIQNGEAIPQHMESTIDARLIGKVNLSIDYSRFQHSAGEQTGTTEQGPPAGPLIPSSIK